MSTPRSMKLLQLAERLRADDLLLGVVGGDADLTGVADDSREVQRGDLFCAWSGTASDGHAYADAAAGLGAAACLVERVL